MFELCDNTTSCAVLTAAEFPEKVWGAKMIIRTENQAVAIRTEWMRLMGFDEEEIQEACYGDDPPTSVDAEEKKLASARRLNQITPSSAQLQIWAIKY